MFKKEKKEAQGLSKEQKWKYIGKPVAIIFGTLNLFILIFFLIYYYA
jgi:hypothetical protein